MSKDTEETIQVPDDGGKGFSRRRALQVGVGVGVGVAAWTGPSITSLGATPAYAAGCTFAVNVQISSDWRNTDQSAGCVNLSGPGTGFGYHAVGTLQNLPAGYTMTPDGWGSQVCSTSTVPYSLVLRHPSNVVCEVEVHMRIPAQGGTLIHIFSTDDYPKLGESGHNPAFPGIPEDSGDPAFKLLRWRLPTGVDIAATGKNFPQSTQYAVFLKCVSPGDEDCFD